MLYRAFMIIWKASDINYGRERGLVERQAKGMLSRLRSRRVWM
jgi:hypothetical protein